MFTALTQNTHSQFLDFRWQPNLESDARDGLLAIGGELTLGNLCNAYLQGVFPWFAPNTPVKWWYPEPRAVMLPRYFRCAKKLKKAIRTNPKLTWKVNTDFESCMQGCAREKDAQVEWLGDEMKQAYRQLKENKLMCSFEAYNDDQLIGAVLVIQFGTYIIGESMFHSKPNGSKIALYGLMELFNSCNQALFDCQIINDHLITLGAFELPRERFHARMIKAQSKKVKKIV